MPLNGRCFITTSFKDALVTLSFLPLWLTFWDFIAVLLGIQDARNMKED